MAKTMATKINYWKPEQQQEEFSFQRKLNPIQILVICQMVVVISWIMLE